ncbi:MAG: 2-phosphosulfolactate phosphatase [Candidatus Synechococcus spongiarum SP3]|uniref:Probable 2-phosphosulfolactate phosphatase n=1 Tax=Candidatus Synechococcus spongiarum SP3 TaxID=1604020 RepID=A0A0G2HL04_9SYNE|nr:MAG: 2-phosphosulfolactate phosphatase [Candidatus Synechococcus spongiarum SP3]
MKVRYCPTPEAVPGSGRPDAAVVIDVLRATTTIGWALHNGATAVHVFADLDDLRKAAAAVPQERHLLAGERGGQALEGFHLGNSPVAVTPAVVEGKQLFLSTTNGTRALERVQAVSRVLTCSLNNLAAVAERLQALAMDHVWIVGSGWEGSYSLEDSLAAGALLHAMATVLDSDPHNHCGNDEMTAAAALWQTWRHNPEACLRLATHGQRLQRLGNHDADFRCCAGVNSLAVVPTQMRPGVLGLV